MIKENKNLISFRKYMIFVLTITSIIGFCTPVFAADDPLSTLNNMSDLMFRVIGIIGYIMLGWGVVQIAMSFKSQDPSQRMNGFMFFAGGVLMANTKAILDFITK